MVALVCASLVLGAAFLALLFLVPGRPPLSESRKRRVVVAGLLAAAVLLTTLLADSVLTTVVFRVPAAGHSFTTPVPTLAIVGAAALILGVIFERTLVWNATHPARARAIAVGVALVALAAPAILFVSARSVVTDFVDLPRQVVDIFGPWGAGVRVPLFATDGGRVTDLEPRHCGHVPDVDHAGERTAHHCAIIEDRSVQQVVAAVPLRRSSQPASASPDWLVRICTRREDAATAHCKVALLKTIETSGLLDDAVIPDVQSVDATADLTAYEEPRLSAWVLVEGKKRVSFSDSETTALDVLIFDAETLAPRSHDVSSREIASAKALVTGRWELLLLPAAILALIALVGFARNDRVRRAIEKARGGHVDPSIYRRAAPREEDDRRARQLEDQLSKCTSRDGRWILFAFCAATAGILPLGIATASHVFDRFPARESALPATTLPLVPNAPDFVSRDMPTERPPTIHPYEHGW